MATPPSDTEKAAHAARLGLRLFGLYCVVFFVFIFISAFAPQLLHEVMPGGVNVAIAYGFGLIFLAFGLAVVYWRGAVHPHDREES
jgi:uncharacterized membrane protein (DUF485 family)